MFDQVAEVHVMKSLFANRFRFELPSWLYHVVGKLLFFRKSARGTLDKPPRHLSFIYGYDPEFSHVGEDFAHLVVDLCALKPDGRVLDIGCGIGRCALPLTSYMSESGEYEGVDVRRDGVAWCKKHIGSNHPNFHFQHLNLTNATYAPLGRGRAADYTFPFPDNYFDAIFTKSVFTHMDLQSIAQYLRESRRMLKPRGHCLHTFFLLNEVSRGLQANGRSQFNFVYTAKDGMSISRSEPEKAIAFDEERILTEYKQAGLVVSLPVKYGLWSGRADGLSGQDIIIATKQ